MPRRPHLAIAVLMLASGLAAGCGQADAPPSNQGAPPGQEKKVDTKILEKGAEALQDLSPVRAIDHYLDGFHVMKDNPDHHMEAHHYCKGINEEFTQCVIFDGNTKDANIIGVEYIISEGMFEGLAEEEKKRWHPHNYEILSGQLTLPGVPAVAEKAALKKKMNSYGKTWHIWDTGHLGHPAAHNLPVGEPLLAWSYNRDGEMPAALVEARDKRAEISTAEKRKERADLAAVANPQRGVDDLKSRFPNATGAPEGVRAK
ncbi:OBAP family protein [Sorangium sp. So ce1151]|uniref:OBAP family protein n=2 Tax=Sorangium TaxID=39643 RepID=UPI003F5DC1B2